MKDVGYNDDENPFGDHNLSKVRLSLIPFTISYSERF